MIAVQAPMMRWTRSRGLIALLEEFRALDNRQRDFTQQPSSPDRA